MVAALGLWGCSQGSATHTAQADRVHTLETKCSKLEDDYKAVAAARDLARKRVATLEEEHARLEEQRVQMQKELDEGKAIVKERDELRQEMDLRTTERDTLQGRCDRLKKGLQTLLGQDDALLPGSHPPAASTATTTGVTGGGL
jgi:outer membrane protein TolC